ncbi:MAG: hypothetical protein U1D69_06170, partial [Polynucleobacter sp.]|nr:hypothetical protein [Polynucleobacter sp.]
VVDQRAGDQSIESGLASPQSVQDMITAAVKLSGQYNIIVKTHPDYNIGGRESAIGKDALTFLSANPMVSVVTDDVNPYSLIDVADKIFVVTSGMGFEAVMAGKEVHCFGVPFYAGWGLTVDSIPVSRRGRVRTIEEVFHAAYIRHSRYFHPELERRCSIDELIDYITSVRPWSNDEVEREVHNEEGRGEQLELQHRRIAPTVLQDVKLDEFDNIWGYNISPWKREYFQSILGSARAYYLTENEPLEKAGVSIRASERPAVLVWGRSQLPGLAAFTRRWKLPVFSMEDGFLRSVGLGANKILPLSFCIDSRGIYFDATCSSDLEVILNEYDFDASPDLMAEAEVCMNRIVEAGLSKYNFPYPRTPGDPFGAKTSKRVLVIGQVEDDASIRYGAPVGITNNDLVRLARAENPDAQVIYKIHPDVLESKRAYTSSPADVADICEISSSPLSLHDSFTGVDHVYTITSLSGFEALMRGIKVTTVGAPF